MLLTALVGFVFGFVGSMPLAGPISVLVFTRGLDQRFLNAMCIAFGGAAGEATYATLAYWGLSTLLSSHPWLMTASRVLTAIVLLALGAFFTVQRPNTKAVPHGGSGWGSGLLLGFTMTALNPTLIASWSGAATTLFSTGLVSFDPAYSLVFGVSAASGITGWFLLMLYLIRRFRARFKETTLARLVQGMGILLIGLGVWFAGSLVYNLFFKA